MKDFNQRLFSARGITSRLSFFAIAAFFVLMTSSLASGQVLVGYDLTGLNQVATAPATTVVPTVTASDLTRGAGAPASAGANSFRTTGFQNNGISTANTDYFQFTVAPTAGNTLSLSALNANLTGTASFAAAPGGVTSQFAYSLDGTNFTLIGSPQTITGVPQALSVDLTGVSALQNVAPGTTVTFRYYASGQTATGGFGFFSASAGTNGLAISGTTAAVATPGTIQFNPTTLTVGEGAGSAMLTVTRTGGTDGAISATYTINNGSATGGACPGADFNNTGGTVNFAAGSSTSQTITIPICDDTVVENNEDFTVTLTGTNVSTTNATATVTIADNDVAALPDLTISQSGPSTATVGSTFDYTLRVSNNGTADQSVDVNFTLPSGVTYNTATAVNGCTSITLVSGVVQFRGCTAAANSSNIFFTINVTAPLTPQMINSPGSNAVVDPNSLIAESNEGNNAATATVTTNVAVVTTAAGVNLSGRVTNSSGNGIERAKVMLMGGSLTEPIFATTDSEGNYSFSDVPAGETYTLSITAKGYKFAQTNIVVNLNQDFTDAHFIGTSLKQRIRIPIK